MCANGRFGEYCDAESDDLERQLWAVHDACAAGPVPEK
jgi:hypothetical protein